VGRFRLGKFFPGDAAGLSNPLQNMGFSPMALPLLGGTRKSVLRTPMIDALFSQTNYAAMKKMLDATALQHQAIAANIGNVEKPGYQRVDLNPSFAAELKQALGSRDAATIFKSPALVDGGFQCRRQHQGRQHGATRKRVDEDETRNTIAHALETQLVTGQLLRLRLAITGRPS
jgi:flagellar basal-body rod protein FlgB